MNNEQLIELVENLVEKYTRINEIREELLEIQTTVSTYNSKLGELTLINKYNEAKLLVGELEALEPQLLAIVRLLKGHGVYHRIYVNGQLNLVAANDPSKLDNIKKVFGE
jgi:hypothetical protein